MSSTPLHTPLTKTNLNPLFNRSLTVFLLFVDGLSHLKGQLKSQSFQRENLVRSHFGLFVHCAEGLEWLKAYRRGGNRIHH